MFFGNHLRRASSPKSRTRAVHVSSLCLLLIGAIAFAQAPTENCPSSFAEWANWREALVSNLKSPLDLASGKSELLGKCKSNPAQRIFFEDPGFAACMEPVEKTIQMIKDVEKNSILNENAGNNLSKRFPRQRHLDDNPEVEELPPFFNSEAFLKLANSDKPQDDATFQQAFAEATKLNPGLEAVQFNSRFGIGERSMVARIPGPRVERWIHLEREGNGLALFSILLAIETEDNTGKKLDPPRIFFYFFMNHDLQGFGLPKEEPIENKPPADHQGMMMAILRENPPGESKKFPQRVQVHPESCMVCHRTGAVPILPSESKPMLSQLSPNTKPQKVLTDFFHFIRKNATAVPRKGTARAVFGPPIGDLQERSMAFLKQCTAAEKLSEDSLPKIAKAMNCARCHSDIGSAGPITYPLGDKGSALIAFNPGDLLQENILSGHMPPGANLSPDERKGLYRCLLQEYYGGFSKPQLGENPKRGAFLRSMLETVCPTGPKPSLEQAAPSAETKGAHF